MKNYVSSIIILLATITAFSCTNESVKEKISKDGDPVKESYGDKSFKDYGFLMNLDTALAHQLEVTHLHLNNEVQYDTLPRGIKNLRNLKSLIISKQNHLDYEHLFESIANLDSLQELLIQDSNLRINGKINKLKQLKVLTLLRNGISVFPFDVLDSLNLEVLSINEEEGFEFTGTLGEGVKLKGLNLYGYSGKTINENIFKLSELERLTIMLSNLTYIGDKVTNLKKLKELNIAKTPLATKTAQLDRLKDRLPRVKIITVLQPPH